MAELGGKAEDRERAGGMKQRIKSAGDLIRLDINDTNGNRKRAEEKEKLLLLQVCEDILNPSMQSGNHLVCGGRVETHPTSTFTAYSSLRGAIAPMAFLYLFISATL